VGELSGGQRQTVRIARALVQQTAILLLDEPIANLDLHHQLEVMRLLKNLSARGLTILMSIHDINMAIPFATHVLMLKEGRILACGTNESVITSETVGRLYDVGVSMIEIEEERLRYIVPHFRSED
jgi:iron complex transport system ATP-binding protein